MVDHVNAMNQNTVNQASVHHYIIRIAEPFIVVVRKTLCGFLSWNTRIIIQRPLCTSSWYHANGVSHCHMICTKLSTYSQASTGRENAVGAPS
jgi:hypothetical protein